MISRTEVYRVGSSGTAPGCELGEKALQTRRFWGLQWCMPFAKQFTSTVLQSTIGQRMSYYKTCVLPANMQIRIVQTFFYCPQSF